MPKPLMATPLLRCLFAGVLFLSIGPSVSLAVDWTEDGGTDNWSDDNNWSSGAPGPLATAVFNPNDGPRTQFVDFDGTTTIANLHVQDGSALGGFSYLDVLTTIDGRPGTWLDITNTLRLRASSSAVDTGRVALVLQDMKVYPGSVAIENDGVSGAGEKFLRLANSELVTGMESDINASKFEIILEDGSYLGNTGSGVLDLGSESPVELAGGSVLDWELELSETLSVQAGGGRLADTAKLDGPVQLNGSTAELRFGDAGAAAGGDPKYARIDGSVAGSGKIVVDDPNYTVQLNAGNSFTGGLVLKAGKAVASSGPRLGGLSNRLFFEGGTLQIIESFNISIESAIVSGGIETSSSATVTGDFYGPASSVFNKSGNGTLTLNNNNSGYLGAYVVEDGTLVSDNGDSFSNSSTVEVRAFATLRFDGAENFDGLNGPGFVEVNGQTLRLGKNDTTTNDFAGELFGGGAIYKDGTGSQRFSGDNSGFTGAFNLTDGSLIFAAGESLGRDLHVPSGSKVEFDPESGETDYAHALSGPGTFEKDGAGTLNLTGDNSGYSGYFYVGEGTVNVEGPLSAGEVAVVEGATVGGNGTIDSLLYAEPGSTIAPGRGIGTLTANEYRMDAGAALAIELAGDVAGVDHDQLVITGDSQINDAKLAVSLVDGFAPTHGDAFAFLSLGGVATGTGFTQLDLPVVPGMAWDTSRVATERVLAIEVVLPGDYNLDGVVDAADYTVWRDSQGQPAGSLPSDVDGGAIGQAQYQTWVAHFGQSLPASASTVPEPTALLLLSLALGFLSPACRGCSPACR